MANNYTVSRSIEDVLGGSLASFIQTRAGLYVPPAVMVKESASKAIEVSPYSVTPMSLEEYVKVQLFQSRYKYFIFGKMYERDTWIRSCIDYISKRATRNDNRLVDEADVLNPDIKELQDFLDNVNSDNDFQEMYYGWLQDLMKYGQAYAYVQKTKLEGKPVAIWPLDARITFPITDFHGTIMFHVQVFNGRVEFFNNDEILFFSINNNGSSPQSLPTMQTLIESVAMELNANKWNSSLFEHGLSIGAVFSMPGATEEEIEDNIKWLDDKYTHPENAHRSLILRGDAKMLRDGVTAQKDLQFEKLVELARQRVCAVFGVPEALIGISHNTNRATGDLYERNTYVTAVRPWRRLLNRQFTRKFIRSASMWGSNSIRLKESLDSMLPTDAEIDAASKMLDGGMLYNDYRELTGQERVAWGDYFVIKVPGAGGLQRLDYVMPGLGYNGFNPDAYQRQHEAQTQQDAELAAQGMQPTPSAVPYAPPPPQYQTQKDSIGARVLDVTRGYLSYSVDWDGIVDMSEGTYEVSRRTPMAPGTRGGNVYFTKTGKPRYGAPPKNAPKSTGGAPTSGKITNPHDNAIPKDLTPQERMQISAAQVEIALEVSQAQDNNWSTDEFINRLGDLGWEQPSGENRFTSADDARKQANYLASLFSSNVYVVLGFNGQYGVMQKNMQDIQNVTQVKQEVADSSKQTTFDKRVSKSIDDEEKWLKVVAALTEGNNNG